MPLMCCNSLSVVIQSRSTGRMSTASWHCYIPVATSVPIEDILETSVDALKMLEVKASVDDSVLKNQSSDHLLL